MAYSTIMLRHRRLKEDQLEDSVPEASGSKYLSSDFPSDNGYISIAKLSRDVKE